MDEWTSISLPHHKYLLIASHVSQLPSLNFLVCIPKRSEYPLHIRQSSKSSDTTDTFLVAQWGGVMIYNPPEIAQLSESKDDNKTSETSLLDSKGALKVAVKMEKVIPVFTQQLKMLLGVPSNEWVCDLLHYIAWYNERLWFFEECLNSHMTIIWWNTYTVY